MANSQQLRLHAAPALLAGKNLAGYTTAKSARRWLEAEPSEAERLEECESRMYMKMITANCRGLFAQSKSFTTAFSLIRILPI